MALASSTRSVGPSCLNPAVVLLIENKRFHHSCYGNQILWNWLIQTDLETDTCSAAELWTSLFCLEINQFSVWSRLRFLGYWEIYSQNWEKAFSRCLGIIFSDINQAPLAHQQITMAKGKKPNCAWLEALVIQRYFHSLNVCFMIFSECSFLQK